MNYYGINEKNIGWHKKKKIERQLENANEILMEIGIGRFEHGHKYKCRLYNLLSIAMTKNLSRVKIHTHTQRRTNKWKKEIEKISVIVDTKFTKSSSVLSCYFY